MHSALWLVLGEITLVYMNGLLVIVDFCTHVFNSRSCGFVVSRVLPLCLLRHLCPCLLFSVVGEVISEPLLLEQYVAIAAYSKKQKNEVNLVAGVSVEVVEKNVNGEEDIL